tara:strand:- start:219 stop:374 length:156 start_codon:yes stop_codon:yes gene_type:complete
MSALIFKIRKGCFETTITELGIMSWLIRSWKYSYFFLDLFLEKETSLLMKA